MEMYFPGSTEFSLRTWVLKLSKVVGIIGKKNCFGKHTIHEEKAIRSILWENSDDSS